VSVVGWRNCSRKESSISTTQYIYHYALQRKFRDDIGAQTHQQTQSECSERI
jgi:hypothetical protein